jgi:hypothetical protein
MVIHSLHTGIIDRTQTGEIFKWGVVFFLLLRSPNIMICSISYYVTFHFRVPMLIWKKSLLLTHIVFFVKSDL